MYEFDSKVRYSELAEDKKLSPVSIINYFQDCCTFEAEEKGVGLKVLDKNHTAWMLINWHIKIDRRPDFNEKAYGCATFYRLLMKLANRFGDLRVKNDNFDVMVGLSNSGENTESIPQLTRDNWKDAFAAQIKAYKDGGFERVNPSILKADIITAYPDFNERAIGFKRFSDVMKQLEKDGLVVVEMDEQNTMLIKLL